MDKINYFRKLIKANRKELIDKGFHPSTLTLWSQGKRFPSLANAKIVARILKDKVSNFPVLKKTRE